MRQSWHLVGIGNLPRTLKFDLILNNQRLSLGIDGLCEFGGDGMMGSLVLDYQPLVALHALEDSWLLDGPVSDVSPLVLRG